MDGVEASRYLRPLACVRHKIAQIDSRIRDLPYGPSLDAILLAVCVFDKAEALSQGNVRAAAKVRGGADSLMAALHG